MKLGSLCSGAGGLDMAVEQAFDAETVWHCEIDAAASKVLAHRWPGVPNHSDLINTDWETVEPIDVLCAGWPCQPFSLAGQRKGAEDDRALWPHIADAVRILRPRIIVLENVSAVLGPEFTRVADSLAACGYDLTWTCLRASDIGAPHRRERVFIVAHTTSERRATDGTKGGPNQTGFVGGSDAPVSGDGPVDLLPTPCAQQSGNTPENHLAKKPGRKVVTDLAILVENGLLETGGELLPTPSVADGIGGHVSRSGARIGELLLPGIVRELFPTPGASDCSGGGTDPAHRKAGGHHVQLIDAVLTTQWGKYAAAIRRWENVTRPAPAPTEPNKNGNPRLSAAFSEWLMGWPAGWVTQVPGISRNDQLRIIGNGVCPQQAAAALTYLLNVCGVTA